MKLRRNPCNILDDVIERSGYEEKEDGHSK